MKYLLLLFYLFNFCIYSFAQEKGNTKFDSIFNATAITIATHDPEKAFLIADSLYQNSPEQIHKLKALMLTSDLHQQTGDNKSAILYALKAKEIADKNKIYEWQARIYGFLSTQYRLIGLTNEGRKFLEKGLNSSKLIPKENTKNLYLSMVYQEETYYSILDENFTQAEEYATRAEEYLTKLPEGNTKKYFFATNKSLLGKVYLHLNKSDTALQSFQDALSMLNDILSDDSSLKGMIYSGIGQAYFQKNETVLAKEYLTKAESIADSSDFSSLKLEVYKALAEYYKDPLTYNAEKNSFYNDKYLKVYEKSEANKKKVMLDLIDSLKTTHKKGITQYKYILLISLSLLLIIIFISFFWFQRKRKKDFLRFKNVLNNLHERDKKQLAIIRDLKNQLNENNLQEDLEDPNKKVVRKNQMPEKTKLKILEGLKQFEEGENYLKNNFSLPSLASKLNTNTKYLSIILNEYYNKDFNNYLNELRINYIIRKLKNNAQYRQYKLSYLAEKSGFSSHSKFSAVFKSITGLPPSDFIKFLESEGETI